MRKKKGSIRNAPLPPGGPDWKDILKKTLKEIKELAQKNVTGYKTGIGTAAKGVFNEMLGDILFSKNTLLDMGSTIINYFSSIGGIIAM